MTKVPTTQTPSTTKPFLSHTSRIKTNLAFLSHCIDPFDESVCDSAEENPLHLDEFKSSPSSPFQSFPNLFELPKPTKTSISNQPWERFHLRNKKITMKMSKWLILTHTQLVVFLNPNHPLFWIQLIFNPS